MSTTDMTHGGIDRSVDRASVDTDDRVHGDLAALREFAEELAELRGDLSGDSEIQDALATAVGGNRADAGTTGRVNVDPEAVEEGLAKLVLTLIEFIRRLLERQAIRRMETGSLTDDEIERMGETFLKLEQKMEELKTAFGLQDETLNLSLGPLGNLLPEDHH